MNSFINRVTAAMSSVSIVGLLSATFLQEPKTQVDTPTQIAVELAALPIDPRVLAAHLERADAHYAVLAGHAAQGQAVAQSAQLQCENVRTDERVAACRSRLPGAPERSARVGQA